MREPFVADRWIKLTLEADPDGVKKTNTLPHRQYVAMRVSDHTRSARHSDTMVLYGYRVDAKKNKPPTAHSTFKDPRGQYTDIVCSRLYTESLVE